MLPNVSLKFWLVNNTGVQLDFSANSANEKATLDIQLWKLGSDATRSTDDPADLTASSDVADGAAVELGTYDNSTGSYWGLWGNLTLETDNGSADGNVLLMVEHADSDGNFPSAESDTVVEDDLTLITVLNLAGAEVVEVPFSYEG